MIESRSGYVCSNSPTQLGKTEYAQKSEARCDLASDMIGILKRMDGVCCTLRNVLASIRGPKPDKCETGCAPPSEQSLQYIVSQINGLSVDADIYSNEIRELIGG